MQLMAFSVTAAITFSSFSIDAFAANNNKVTSVMPQAGISYALGNNQVSLSSLQESVELENGTKLLALKVARNRILSVKIFLPEKENEKDAKE